jgi:hypothetical protein
MRGSSRVVGTVVMCVTSLSAFLDRCQDFLWTDVKKISVVA